MLKNRLVLLAMAFVVFGLGLVGAWIYTQKPSQEITPPKATGKIDDLEKSLLLELTDEASLFAEEEKDSSLVEGDSSEASGFTDTADVQY